MFMATTIYNCQILRILLSCCHLWYFAVFYMWFIYLGQLIHVLSFVQFHANSPCKPVCFNILFKETIFDNIRYVIQINIKDIGGGQGPFFIIILFNLVLTKLQDAFYRFYKFKIFFEIWPVKVRGYNMYLMGGAN